MTVAAPESNIRLLLDSVARRLWLARALATARLASWATAAILLVAAATRVIAGSATIDGLRNVLLLLWGTAMAWSLARRPRPAECALWADRNLGGESAFSTWLEFRQATPRPSQATALHRLGQWSEAAATRSLHLLTGRRESTGLGRPLATAAICAAVAVVVLQLPTANHRSIAESVAQSPGSESPSRESSPPRVPGLDDDALAEELATALRSTTAGRDASERGADSVSSAPDHAYDDGREPVAHGRQEASGAVETDRKAQSATAGVATTATGPESGPGSAAHGAGSGRDAGDSRDERHDRGASRPLPASAAASGAGEVGPPSTADRQANMDQRASFDERLATQAPATYGRYVEALPATPPPAAYAARLTPAQSAYVRAWRETTDTRP